MDNQFVFDKANPLHRCPNESARANAALRAYFKMGAGRSLRALLERYKGQAIDELGTERPPTKEWCTLSLWSSKFGWQARVAAQDSLDLAEDEATWRERRRKALERDWTTGDKLLALAEQILNEGPKFLKATTRTVKGRPARVDVEGRLLDPGEPDQKVTIIALSGDLAVKAATAGSDLARRATGLDIVKHEVSGKVAIEGKLSPEQWAVLEEAEKLVIARALDAEGKRPPLGAERSDTD